MLPPLTGNAVIDSILYGAFFFACATCFFGAMGSSDE